MKTNAKKKARPVENSASSKRSKTHGGADAVEISALNSLRRSVLSCLLWEKTHYEDGVEIATRIKDLVKAVSPRNVIDLAIEARESYKLRHVPLLLLREVARHSKLESYLNSNPSGLAKAIARVCRRADEPAEFLSIYWSEGRCPVSKQVRRGLAWSLNRFSEYELAKYNRDNDVTLKDVLYISHAKPLDADQNYTISPAVDKKGYRRGPVFRHESSLFSKISSDSLETPDTWEVSLSSGQDKKETFTRLIKTGKLGYDALLKNLRNMEQAGVDEKLIRNAILARRGAEMTLPFRYIAAAKAAPHFENTLDLAMIAALEVGDKLPGKTIIVVDISGSMHAALSGKSQMNRMDAACALAAVLRASCDTARVYATAGSDSIRKHATEEVIPRQGMALIDSIKGLYGSLGGGGIFLKPCLDHVLAIEKKADRIVVITDEQDCAVADKDSPKLANPFGKRNYLLNVGADKNGIGYGKWVHLDGFSEAVVRFIHEYERSDQ